MMSLLRLIRKQLDKLPKSDGLLTCGQWRVKYQDGWSKLMTYDVATDYAEMFNGTVHWIRYNDEAEKGN